MSSINQFWSNYRSKRYKIAFKKLEKLADSQPKEVMKAIKTRQLFLHSRNFLALHFLKNHSNSTLRDFYRTIAFFKKRHDELELQVRKHDDLIRKTSVEDLLIHFSLWLEKIKHENAHNLAALDKGISNKYHSYTIGFGQILLKKKEDNLNIKFQNSIEFGHEMMSIIGQKLNHPKAFEPFEKMFVAYGEYQYFHHDSILSTFSYDENYKAVWHEDILELQPHNLKGFHLWEKNGFKYQYYQNSNLLVGAEYAREWIEKGYIPLPQGSSAYQNTMKIAHGKIISQSLCLREYGIENKIKLNERTYFNPYLSVTIAEIFGANLRFRFARPMFQLSQQFPNANYLELIRQVWMQKMVIGKQSVPLSWFKYNELLDKACNAIRSHNIMDIASFGKRLTRSDIKNALDALILDLSTANYINILEQPILKIGEACITFPTFLSEGNIATLITNILMKYYGKNAAYTKSRRKERNEETSLMEKTLAKTFQQQNFKTFHSFEPRINNSSMKFPEIDCLAYKDNTLFVIEIKSTHIRASLKERYDNYHLMKKAGDQLEIREKAIEEHFDIIKGEFKNKFDLDIPRYEDLTIYPLIVSTSFEYDYKHFNRYKKISLFELNTIINNEKSCLLGAMQLDSVLLSKKYPHFDFTDLSFENMNSEAYINIFREIYQKATLGHEAFYENKENYTSQEIISAIEEDKAWNFLDEKTLKSFNEAIIQVNTSFNH